MTPEQRLDRLERLAKLFARQGLRARSRFNQQYEILLDVQMRCEARFAQNEERFARNEERFARNEKRFAKLLESQARTDRRLNSLIEILKKGSNGSESRDREA